MLIKLSVEQLIARNACKEGVTAFQETFGGEAKIEWTLAKQLELLQGPLKPFVFWAWFEGFIPIWSMSLANLSGANLYGAFVGKSNLYTEKFHGFGWEIDANNRLQKIKEHDGQGQDRSCS